MNEQKRRIEELFQAALELDSPDQRASFLDRECVGEPALREEVEEFLRASEAAEAVFQPHERVRAPERVEFDQPIQEHTGSVIGRYKLLQQIGEGGMGVVYMAEQQEPVRRRVALKIIKLGMDTRQVVARFEAERQALALMDHPNIAKVLDGGATASGRPYFVMELVQGIPITRFCDQNHLSAEERLKLFIAVCQAIQHAHQKGIIHRDLKPTNVLVTLNDPAAAGHPMVIDFGVAKATNQKLTEKTLFTNFATMIGTPAYMSPEQAEMSKLDVDTRSDIYSLGVLLYELLTGTTPFPEERLRSAGYVEMQRIICEEAPEKPSTKLTKVSRAANPGRIALKSQIKNQKSKIENDLDWIVMKCLEKDRTRRYDTANGLAADLQRHLDNEPVLARPPSRLYEFQKSVRRHKVGFAATVTVMLVLLGGVLVSSREAARARQAEHQARQRAYLSDMRTVGESLGPNPVRARRLLKDYQPHPGEEDVRDFEWYYFNHVLSVNESEILGSHPGGAMTLFTEPDGTFITAGRAVSWPAAGRVQIWDGIEGKLKTGFDVRIRKPNGAIGIALSQDGKWLAICYRNLDIELRSMDNPEQVQRVLTNWHRGLRLDAWTMALCFLDHDTQLAVGEWSVNGNTSLPLTFVQIASDRTNQSLPFAPPLGLNGLVVSRDGRRLAVKDDNGRLLVLDFPGGRPVCRIENQDARWFGVYPAMTFLNDSDRLVITSNSGKIDEWDLATTNRVGTIGNHGSFVSALALSSDGKRLASVGRDERIRVWDPQVQVEGPPLRVLRGHTDWIFGVGFLPDGQTLVSCGRDGTVRRWDLRKPGPPEERWTLPPETKYATMQSGLLGAVEAGNGKLEWKVWDVSHLPEPIKPRPISPPSSMPGAIVAPLFGTPYHLVWPKPGTEGPTQALLYRGLDPPERVSGFPEIQTGDGFIDVKNQLLTVHGAIRGVPHDLVWDLTRSRLIHLVKSPMGFNNVRDAFASDGSFVILSAGFRLTKLDLTTGVSEVWQDATPGMVISAAILPDKRTVLISGGFGLLGKLDFPTRRTKEVNGSPMAITCMCLSPSGTRVATGDRGGHVRLWDVQTLHEVALLGTHPEPVRGLYFTPDGRNLLSVDTTELRVWRAADR
jgi:eukaryotic-like serine/threonine-protein kinase